MKKTVLLLGVMLFALNIQAQIDIEKSNTTDCATTEQIYDVQKVDKQPKFPGGTTSLQSYINRSLQYPQISLENGSQGRTVVRFIINADGTVASPEVVRTSGDLNLDMEALRVVETMPKWKPGRIGKKKVRVYFVIPIVFILQ